MLGRHDELDLSGTTARESTLDRGSGCCWGAARAACLRARRGPRARKRATLPALMDRHAESHHARRTSRARRGAGPRRSHGGCCSDAAASPEQPSRRVTPTIHGLVGACWTARAAAARRALGLEASKRALDALVGSARARGGGRTALVSQGLGNSERRSLVDVSCQWFGSFLLGLSSMTGASSLRPR
jgi:hypothetical protein